MQRMLKNEIMLFREYEFHKGRSNDKLMYREYEIKTKCQLVYREYEFQNVTVGQHI